MVELCMAAVWPLRGRWYLVVEGEEPVPLADPPPRPDRLPHRPAV